MRVVFEATDNYHRRLAHVLLNEGFHLELIASLAVARTREAMHNSWDKNDPKDAQVLLHRTHPGKCRVDLCRLLTHSLPLYFPEIELLPCHSFRVADRLPATLSHTGSDRTSLDGRFRSAGVDGRRAQGE